MAQKVTVLFVEDDSGVRNVLPQVLPDSEFDSLVASSGSEAMRVLTERHVDVLVSDVVMAGMTGIELANQATSMQPDLRVVLMTGYLSRGNEAAGVAPLMYKPVRPDELEHAVRQVLTENPRRPH